MNPDEYQARVAKAMSEPELQNNVIDLAMLKHWWVYHTHDSRRSHKGFPDLVLVRNGYLIFAELKSEKGVLRAAQHVWADELNKVEALNKMQSASGGNVAIYLWRPSNYLSGEIQKVLA